MTRIAPVVSNQVDMKVATTLAQVEASLGMVPNLFATLAKSSASLDGYLGLKKTLSRGRLTARQREILSLVAGQENGCQYCLSAHTHLAKAAGLSEAEVVQARSGRTDDPFERALASFAREVILRRGHISDEALRNAQKAGIDDGLVIEIIANVALNTLTNYVNEVAKTAVDFPVVEVKL